MQRIEWLFGLPNILDTDMVFYYQTSLQKDQNKKNEALLYILYNYRYSFFAEAIVVLFENILNAILMESSGVVLEFLLNTFGQSYNCRRYWDWFEPFVL